jgi:hypothetical protein
VYSPFGGNVTSSNSMRGAVSWTRSVSVPAAMTGAVSTARMRSSVARVLSRAGANSLMVEKGSR